MSLMFTDSLKKWQNENFCIFPVFFFENLIKGSSSLLNSYNWLDDLLILGFLPQIHYPLSYGRFLFYNPIHGCSHKWFQPSLDLATLQVSAFKTSNLFVVYIPEYIRLKLVFAQPHAIINSFCCYYRVLVRIRLGASFELRFLPLTICAWPIRW